MLIVRIFQTDSFNTFELLKKIFGICSCPYRVKTTFKNHYVYFVFCF